MQLHYNPASPYVRKVLVLAHETGISDRLELVTRAVSPIKLDDALLDDNPIGKIPTLVLDDGTALYDSRVICEYLDGLHDGPRMFPAEGSTRWAALTRQALADGILDAAVITRYETFLRPEALRWAEWIEAQKLKFRRALDSLERESASLSATLNIGTIATGCALAYLNFRYPEEHWRHTRPKLAAWFERFAARPSMQATRPA